MRVYKNPTIKIVIVVQSVFTKCQIFEKPSWKKELEADMLGVVLLSKCVIIRSSMGEPVLRRSHLSTCRISDESCMYEAPI